ncbi:MAG: tyrosine-type recombinase/integrase [Spirochaetales bacterium]|nr:tyrosine-type recombinase/integrase [Spirochaetales bacterium]
MPQTLSRQEILSILDTIPNKKHKLMMSFLYGSGLRLSEVINIRVQDINPIANTLRVNNSKAHKDRITIISDHILKDLLELIKDRKANSLVFETISGNKYSKRTVQLIFKKALLKSGIKKKATCHTLRHSFATHLVDNGVDIRNIKTLLGHKSVNTTMIYLHLTDPVFKNIKSPL